MADKQLINAIADTGIPHEDAEDMVDRVFSAMRDLLVAGKTVGIPDIGRLRAPPKVAKVGFPPDFLREQRKVVLMAGATLEQGEPYPDPRARPKKRSTYATSY